MAEFIIRNKMANFSELKGKVITGIIGLTVGSESVSFHCEDGSMYSMYHDQSCCESVSVEDICGEVSDLLDSPVLVAEESTSDKNPEGVKKDDHDSFTWTFYKIDTAKGGVTIRWYGESNGYYSESVEFSKTK